MVTAELKRLTPEGARQIFESLQLTPNPNTYYDSDSCEACLVGGLCATLGMEDMDGAWSVPMFDFLVDQHGYSHQYLNGLETGFFGDRMGGYSSVEGLDSDVVIGIEDGFKAHNALLDIMIDAHEEEDD